MGMMDNVKDKFSDMSEEAKARFEELKSREQSGTLDDKGRQELQEMKDKLNSK